MTDLVQKGVRLKYLYFAFKICRTRKRLPSICKLHAFIEIHGANWGESNGENNFHIQKTFMMSCRVGKKGHLVCLLFSLMEMISLYLPHEFTCERYFNVDI